MKKASTIIAALAIAVLPAAANNPHTPISAVSPGMTLDTRTQGHGALEMKDAAAFDSRGLTFGYSDEIDLNTMRPVPTIIIVR